MAELTNRERLQPSLLDRLTDDEPGNPRESREKRVLSVKKLKDSVLRDLEWLLNTEFLANSTDLTDYPQVAASVLNYGRPPLSGKVSSSVPLNQLKEQFRQAILQFEPRIIPDSLVVRAAYRDEDHAGNRLEFEIQGQLWAQPLPLSLFLRTEVDMDSGTIGVYEE